MQLSLERGIGREGGREGVILAMNMKYMICNVTTLANYIITGLIWDLCGCYALFSIFFFFFLFTHLLKQSGYSQPSTRLV
jgi:hypothetical protein